MNDCNELLINKEEQDIAYACLEAVLRAGASGARVCLSKNTSNSVQLLGGELDKVTRSADRILEVAVFADGKFGNFSTNRISPDTVPDFAERAVRFTRLLNEDPFRTLPSPERYAGDAVTGTEAGLYDPDYSRLDESRRLDILYSGSGLRCGQYSGECNLISEESAFYDVIGDVFMIDSQGFQGRHIETNYSYASDLTIQDRQGNRYSGYWWESSPFSGKLDHSRCFRSALARAEGGIGARKPQSGNYTAIMDNTVSRRIASPLISALAGNAIQQHNSFLDGTLGQKIFPDALTIEDRPRWRGEAGARLFDAEGVATADRKIIGGGTVEMYFINTYMGNKMKMAPTASTPSLPWIRPFVAEGLECKENDINLQVLMNLVQDGIVVTDIIGGNCNDASGAFSYPVEGFMFKGGKPVCPIKETIVSGDMTGLWKNVIAAGNDPKPGARSKIPSLVFRDVCFIA